MPNLNAVILILAMILASWLFPGLLAWLIVLACMSVFLLILGNQISKRPLGILIDERNLMSLSRFQMVIWTLIVLSGYFVIAVARVKHAVSPTWDAAALQNALDVRIDWQLWALMGISATSLIGSPLISNTKKQKVPSDAAMDKAAKALVASQNVPDSLPDAHKNDPAQVKATLSSTSQGTLYANPTLADARFSDMFEGDEVGNTAYVDLSKVQMFYFTIIAALSYMVTLAAGIKAGAASMDALPPLSEGMVALLGISHAGFLAARGVNHT